MDKRIRWKGPGPFTGAHEGVELEADAGDVLEVSEAVYGQLIGIDGFEAADPGKRADDAE